MKTVYARSTNKARQQSPIGRLLVDAGVITSDQLVRGLQAQLKLNAPLGDILVAEGWAKPEDILTALATQHNLARVDLTQMPPEPKLTARRCAEVWLREGLIAWRNGANGQICLATERPDQFER